jgi:hypothetical protein
VAVEWSFTSSGAHSDPFNEVELDVIFTGPDGREQRVPAFWGGEREWRVRFSTPDPGVYSFRTVCSDAADSGLHDKTGELRVKPYEGDNPLFKHGPLRVAENRRYLEHRDGTPFFWLGDTWWMALTWRLGWPDDMQALTADRKAKGFTLIHMVAGLYPDMGAFDRNGANEGGQSWEPEWARINPAYFDAADRKVQWLVRSGLTPMLVGAWAYYLPWLGMEKMKRHWRYLVARYGAYPVVWCLAGELAMPWYLTPREDSARVSKWQMEGWTEIARYLRAIDPYPRPLSSHCSGKGSDELLDASLLDFDMIQTGHGGFTTAVNAARKVNEAVASSTRPPVINSEVCYEGILGVGWQDIQRFCFWTTLLSGAPGFSYGANGVWQFNLPGDPTGPSPHGMTWGDVPWQEASRLPGGAQVGRSKRLLDELPWHRMAPHQEWIDPAAGPDDWFRPYAAGSPGEFRIVYFPSAIGPWHRPRPTVRCLNDGAYKAFWFDPVTGNRETIGAVQPNAEGEWEVPAPVLGQDLVLVLLRA